MCIYVCICNSVYAYVYLIVLLQLWRCRRYLDANYVWKLWASVLLVTTRRVVLLIRYGLRLICHSTWLPMWPIPLFLHLQASNNKNSVFIRTETEPLSRQKLHLLASCQQAMPRGLWLIGGRQKVQRWREWDGGWRIRASWLLLLGTTKKAARFLCSCFVNLPVCWSKTLAIDCLAEPWSVYASEEGRRACLVAWSRGLRNLLIMWAIIVNRPCAREERSAYSLMRRSYTAGAWALTSSTVYKLPRIRLPAQKAAQCHFGCGLP